MVDVQECKDAVIPPAPEIKSTQDMQKLLRYNKLREQAEPLERRCETDPNFRAEQVKKDEDRMEKRYLQNKMPDSKFPSPAKPKNPIPTK